MTFNTLLFALFFVLLFIIFWFVLRGRTARLWTILVSSIIFYAGWNYKFVPLLVITALFDFFIARAIAYGKVENRKWLLALSIVLNLGVLAFFKYVSFVLASLCSLLGVAGFQISAPALAITLPVGVSFYTFQSMSYTVDVYRG